MGGHGHLPHLPVPRPTPMNRSTRDRNTRTCTTTAAIWLSSKPVQTPRPTTEGIWLTRWPSTCSPPLSLLPQTAILVPASQNQCHRTQSPSCPGCREVFPGCPSGSSITAPLVRKPCVSDEPGCPQSFTEQKGRTSQGCLTGF